MSSYCINILGGNKVTIQVPRHEYPRPQFQRNCWMNLNGEWDFTFDDLDIGIKSRWYKKATFDHKIIVPYVYQCQLSEVNTQEFHDIIWYKRTFDLPDEMKGKRILLHFGAVDYTADVWVNGEHLICHEGGHVPFFLELTHVVQEQDNVIVVRAYDPTTDLELPRGKQYWKKTSESIFYTRTTGIWQTVWLEGVSTTYIKKIRMTPDIDRKKIEIEYEMDGYCKDLALGVEIRFQDQKLIHDKITVLNQRGKRDFWLDQQITMDWNHQESWTWTPENPVLFDVTFELYQDTQKIDEAISYFGMRKVSICDGVFMLNNRPYYQKMLLDQGYWEESLLTAPKDEDFRRDIELSKQMGFNGVRKHQKIEDPRFLYWADQLGFLVWGEMANAYTYSRRYVSRITNEWIQMIDRDYNHPCIIVWTPLNESWGVDCIMNNTDEQAHSAAMYWLTKSLDQSRLVVSNDGWDHTTTDLLTIHDYEWQKDILKERYSSIENILKSRHAGRGMFAKGWSYQEQPIIASEIAGISYKKGNWSGWGYSSATSDEDFANRYYQVVSAFLESPLIQGFVITQITDVEQEINGVMTYDRNPKIDPEIIRQINAGEWKPDKK